jgi:hypothetical protein
MNLGTYGILIAFAAFIVLLILNPKLSCFGRRIRSPFYPVLRGRRKKTPAKVPTEDYGFKLSQNPPPRAAPRRPADKQDKAEKKTDDYGFRLD